jgi:hypothetical protein
MSSHLVVTVEIPIYARTTASANDPVGVNLEAADPADLYNYVARLCEAARSGALDAGITVRQLGLFLPVATFPSFTVVRANFVVGDILRFVVPGGEFIDLVGVTGTPNPLLGQYGQGAATDADFAASIRAAINSNNRLLKYFSAGGAANAIVLTGKNDSTVLNTIRVFKIVTTAAVFSFTTGTFFSGAIKIFDNTAASQYSVTIPALPTVADTLVIGGVVLTWVALAANNTQVTIGANTTIAATNLAAAINANPTLRNYVSATANTNIVLITALAASPTMRQWVVVKTGTWAPTITGQLFPVNVVVEGADRLRQYNIK